MSVQFYGYNFGGTGVVQFFAFMHSFQKSTFKILVTFQTSYVVKEPIIEKALTC